MRTIVTLITAAAFLLHFALGCCAHHAHAAEGSSCCHHTTVAVHECHGHEGHGHQHDLPPSEESPDDSVPPKHECCESHCVFMAAGKTTIAKVAFLAHSPLFVAEPTSFVQLSPVAVAAIDSGGTTELPVRIHVLNQVFLI